MTESPPVAPGALRLGSVPAGMPDADLRPPVVAESDDPFTALRVIRLVSRLERGRAVRLDDLLDALNAEHLDWLFTRAVLADVLIQLQSNWIADYRSTTGIVIEEAGPYGATVTVEDSSRVDPWIVRQAERAVRDARQRLLDFSRLDRASGG